MYISATIAAYFCISLGDGLAQQPRRAILNCREQPLGVHFNDGDFFVEEMEEPDERVCPHYEKQENQQTATSVDFIARNERPRSFERVF